MTHGLTTEQVAGCTDEGFVFPINVLSAEEAEGYHQLYNEALRHDAASHLDELCSL